MRAKHIRDQNHGKNGFQGPNPRSGKAQGTNQNHTRKLYRAKAKDIRRKLIEP